MKNIRRRCELFTPKDEPIENFGKRTVPVHEHYDEVHKIILSVEPGCLVGLRVDRGLIYVPQWLKQAHASGEGAKNLITVWATSKSIRFRILEETTDLLDTEHELYRPSMKSQLKQRLVARLKRLKEQHAAVKHESPDPVKP